MNVKRVSLILLFSIIVGPLFARLADPWSYTIDKNPAKLFFQKQSLFIGEINFGDVLMDKNSPSSFFQRPSMNINITILGGIVGLNVGTTVSMTQFDEKYTYDSLMNRYININFAVGVEMVAFGVGLSISDNQRRTADFEGAFPLFGFFREAYFKRYIDVPGSVNTSLALSIMVSDNEYFGITAVASEFMLFNTNDPVFDSKTLLNSLNFGFSFRSPRYNSMDELNPVVATFNLDTNKVFSTKKHFYTEFDLALIFSPSMRFKIKNGFDIYYDSTIDYQVTDNTFIHNIIVSFESKNFITELGFNLLPSLYRKENTMFAMHLNLCVLL